MMDLGRRMNGTLHETVRRLVLVHFRHISVSVCVVCLMPCALPFRRVES
jgi:hypothetical protein